MVHSLNKGKSGEREAAKWLQTSFGLELPPIRNLEQTRSGGHDLVGFDPFCIEVKRCETLSLTNWWLQVLEASKEVHGSIPVVMFRQNRKKWEFLISARHIKVKYGFIRLRDTEFIRWAERQLDNG